MYKVAGEPLAAGFAYDLVVHLGGGYTINQIGGTLQKCLQRLLEVTLKGFRHELKVQLKCIIQKNEDGVTFASFADFPADGFQKVWEDNDSRKFQDSFEDFAFWRLVMSW